MHFSLIACNFFVAKQKERSEFFPIDKGGVLIGVKIFPVNAPYFISRLGNE